MIPKTIHYCWFGRKVKPADVAEFIAGWQKALPDYKIKEWNESNFPIKNWKYAIEAYRMKKYAFVSDVCRLYALYHEGGIYLDTDIQVLRSFDPFISLHSFAGYEAMDYIGTGIIGAEKGCKWIKDFLDTYTDDCFILKSGNLKLLPNVIRLRNFFKTYDNCMKPRIYPIDYFCAKDWNTGILKVTDNTVCIHHYKNSWNQPTCFIASMMFRIKSLIARIVNRCL